MQKSMTASLIFQLMSHKNDKIYKYVKTYTDHLSHNISSFHIVKKKMIH